MQMPEPSAVVLLLVKLQSEAFTEHGPCSFMYIKRMQLKQIKGLHAFTLYQPTDPQNGYSNPENSRFSNCEEQNTQNN